MKKSFRFIFAFLFSLNAVSVFSEKISFSANSMSGTIGDKSDSTTLSGEASVITESMEIYADSITMTGENYRFIEAFGNIKGVNLESELEFTCGKLKYDRETKVADLSEKVSLKDTKNDVEAKAELIQYSQETDIAVMQIDIELKQKDNVCNGVYAVYRKKDQMLELSGNAQIKQGSDTFRAQEITLNMDSQEITLDGRVKGSIVDERQSGAENMEASEETPAENVSSENASGGDSGESAGRAENGKDEASGEKAFPAENSSESSADLNKDGQAE